jgi:ATP-dependent RNA helicase DDX54/DBP10
MGKGTDLRTVLLVGGDSLEEQFASVMQNPDMYLPSNFLSLIEVSLQHQAVSCI